MSLVKSVFGCQIVLRTSRLPRIVVRTLAVGIGHAPPMKLHGVSGGLVNDLYRAASEAGKLTEVEAELVAFQDVLQSEALSAFLADGSIPRIIKVKKVEKLMKYTHTSEIIKDFIAKVGAGIGLHRLDSVISRFSVVMKVARTVSLVVASPLEKEQIAAILEACKNLGMIQELESVRLNVYTDPSLLGGFTIRVGDYLIDKSLKTQMVAFSKNLSAETGIRFEPPILPSSRTLQVADPSALPIKPDGTTASS